MEWNGVELFMLASSGYVFVNPKRKTYEALYAQVAIQQFLLPSDSLLESIFRLGG